MEELIMYETDLLMELDELQEECNAMIDQRKAMMEAWCGEDIDPIEMASRIQTMDALLSVNYRLMSENYAELKRIDKEIGWCMAEPPEEECVNEEDDDY